MDMGAGAVMMREAVVVLDDGVLEKGENLGEGEDMEGKGKRGTVIRVWIYIRLFRGFLFFFFLSPPPFFASISTKLTVPHNRHLMVKHGLLSPNSKLLPRESESRMDVDGRPGSIMSVVSNGKGSFISFISISWFPLISHTLPIPHHPFSLLGPSTPCPFSALSPFPISLFTLLLPTPFLTDPACTATAKTGIIKDERDTPMRRVRHRDGRLLRGGIGLTTGLGWSDRWVSFHSC